MQKALLTVSCIKRVTGALGLTVSLDFKSRVFMNLLFLGTFPDERDTNNLERLMLTRYAAIVHAKTISVCKFHINIFLQKPPAVYFLTLKESEVVLS